MRNHDWPPADVGDILEIDASHAEADQLSLLDTSVQLELGPTDPSADTDYIPDLAA